MKNSLFSHFIRNPRQVGACCPSGPALCHEIVSNMKLNDAELVVELGPGTGAITKHIVEAMNNPAKLLGVELNSKFVEELQNQYCQSTFICDSASNLPAILKDRNLPLADVVLSGLPWAVFPESLQMEILTSVYNSMKDGGKFATFAYLQGLIMPAGIRFRKQLETQFSKVEISKVVWKNLPPAIVYRCQK
jgi:phospholipid N-methyltransferase